MKNAFFSTTIHHFNRAWVIGIVATACCLFFSACHNQRYYLPGGGRSGSNGGGCGCPSFSAANPDNIQFPDTAPAAASAGKSTCTDA